MHGSLWKGYSRVILVDGHHLLYRCWHRSEKGEQLRAPNGMPTAAMFGFIRALLAFREEIPADAGAVVFDTNGSDSRRALLPAYKGNRSPMPDELRAQLKLLQGWVPALGWSLFKKDGVEADDILGSLAIRGGTRETVIVTGDKDMLQVLAYPGIAVWRAGGRGDAPYQLVTSQYVRDRYGIEPKQIPDFLGLVGDTADNIPGVPGIGPKYAANLLREFGSTRAIVDAANAGIERPRMNRVAENTAAALLCTKLATLELDHVPPSFTSSDDLKFKEEDCTWLLKQAEQLGFNSLVPRWQASVVKL